MPSRVLDAPLPVLLLPGMDGTGRLYARFAAELPSEIAPRIIAYPQDPRLKLSDYVDSIALPDGPFGIVAESFSGPIAIELAARHPERVSHLALAATFVRTPSSVRLARLLPAAFFDVVPPAF